MGIDLICETVLYAISLTAAIYSSYTDIKHHIVRNKVLLVVLLISVPFNMIYYLYCNRMIISKYVSNVVICTVISLMLYHLKIWGGGDSKLFILIAVCIPARLYYFNYNDLPLIELPIFVFSFGYIYLLLESVILNIKKKRLVLPTKEDIFRFLRSYVFLSIYMILFSEIIRRIVPGYFYSNALFFWLICSMFSILFSEFSFFHNKYIFLVALILDIILKTNNSHFSFYPYLIILLLYFLKVMISAYNYKTVGINDIHEGDVLSTGSVLLFQNSRIKNLPSDISENLNARLSSENIEAIQKWSKTHEQIAELTIVAKIPFVIFILLGYVYFILIEVLR